MKQVFYILVDSRSCGQQFLNGRRTRMNDGVVDTDIEGGFPQEVRQIHVGTCFDIKNKTFNIML